MGNKLFGRKEEEPTYDLAITPRYKIVQNVITKKWAVWDTKEDEYVDLMSEHGYWWNDRASSFRNCWTEDKAIAQAVFEAVCETGKIWK